MLAFLCLSDIPIISYNILMFSSYCGPGARNLVVILLSPQSRDHVLFSSLLFGLRRAGMEDFDSYATYVTTLLLELPLSLLSLGDFFLLAY